MVFTSIIFNVAEIITVNEASWWFLYNFFFIFSHIICTLNLVNGQATRRLTLQHNMLRSESPGACRVAKFNLQVL